MEKFRDERIKGPKRWVVVMQCQPPNGFRHDWALLDYRNVLLYALCAGLRQML